MAMTGGEISPPVERRARRPAADLLAAAAERVRRIDARNTWQVAAGAALVPLGIVIILFAWYGAAHTPYVQQQIPYLVSGSFIGLGLMVVGGLLYWAHWLYRIYDQADLHHAEQLGRQEELFERLIEAVAAPPRAAVLGMPPADEAPAARAAGDGADLVVTATGTNVHRADCPIVARRHVGARRLTVAELAGRPACRICQPLDQRW